MSKPKLALVGVGKIAVDQHLPSIAETGLFDLVALVSQRGVSHGDLPTFRSQTEMFAAMPEVQAVANCTPPDVRHALVREALASGRHVLMEKPPTASLMELEDLVAAARHAGRTLFATWHSQFNPAVDEARALLARQEIRSLDVTWKEDVRRWHPGQEWIWQAGGFGVFDPGINALSILTKILPFRLFPQRAELVFPANRDTPIAASIGFRTSQLARLDHAAAAFDWRQEGEQTWTIAIETAAGSRIELTRGGTCLSVDGVDRISAGDQEYRLIYRRFADLVRTGAIDVDADPLRIVADCFLLGRRVETAPFDW